MCLAMAHFPINSSLILLFISACLGILMTEGRSLKSMKKQDEFHHQKYQKGKEITHGSTTLKRHDMHLENIENLQVSPTGQVLGAGFLIAEKKVALLPQAPTESEEQGNAKPQFIDAFRPTMPGKSPGAGHSSTEHRLHTQSEAHDNDFRPAGPGHSPGAGHLIRN